MNRYAKVVEQKTANITLPNGVETYYAFQAGRQKGERFGGTIYGHYATRAEAEVAAHAYRCGKNPQRLVCEQTKKLME